MATLINRRQAAKMLCISYGTLKNARPPLDKIKFYHVGTSVVYVKEEIQKLIDVEIVGLLPVVPCSDPQLPVVPCSDPGAQYSFIINKAVGKEYKLSSVIRAYYHKQYEEMTKETIKPDAKQVKAFNSIIKRLSESKPEKYNEQYFCALVEFCLQQGIVALSAIVSESLRGSFELELKKREQPKKSARRSAADNMEYV
ncbi:hypothetical protein [Sulfuricurvum sp.]|uniref:hypothetical protein n=1 Tax=Sulfuricurvum sp. TaxID=2025608 RepID=UPI003568CE70